MQYEGQISDGQMHGRGKLTYPNGESYDGEWHKGKRHGKVMHLMDVYWAMLSLYVRGSCVWVYTSCSCAVDYIASYWSVNEPAGDLQIRGWL